MVGHQGRGYGWGQGEGGTAERLPVSPHYYRGSWLGGKWDGTLCGLIRLLNLSEPPLPHSSPQGLPPRRWTAPLWLWVRQESPTLAPFLVEL